MMKDIHSHILNGIDDGARTIEESLELLRKAELAGITDIVLTPHYIKNTRYNCNNRNKSTIARELVKRMKEEDIKIKLYLGNEVFIDEEIIKLIREKEIATINNTRYILVELPMNSALNNAIDIMFDLIRHGYIPILAHPERYTYIQNDISKLDKFLEIGVLLQGNYLSLYGKYGRNAEKVLKKLLKDKKIHFLASDIHHANHEYHLEKIEKKLLSIVKDKDYIEDILNNNFDLVVNGIEI